MSARIWVPRVFAVVVAVGALVVAGLGTSGLVDRVGQPCSDQPLCELLERPTPATIRLLESLGVTVTQWAVAIAVLTWAMLIGFIVLGLLLVWRRPATVTAVTAAGLVGSILGPFLSSVGNPGDVAPVAGAALGQALLVLLFGLFPDGRWHPRWLRLAWPALALLMAAPGVGYAAFGEPAPDSALTGAIDAGGILLLLAFQVHRFLRVSDWAARQQAKWVLAGFSVLVGNVLLSTVLDVAGVVASWQLLLVLLDYLALITVGFGIGFAVLRYRLYDVTLVLRRTAVYGAAVLLLTIGYFGLVQLASLSVARGSAPLIGAAVLAALALGGGLLAGRIAAVLRRRFYGARGHPGGVAAALVSGIADSGGPANLAETIGVALDVPYTAVLARDGTPLWTWGEPVDEAHRESVLDGSGEQLGLLLLGSEDGVRLDRRARRALREVLPFVVLLLRAHDEAEQLRVARVAAATAREDERRRLRRDLHDGIGPLLAGQLLTLDSLRVADRKNRSSEQFLAHLEQQARSAITEVRRISRDLRPAALDAGGLAVALRAESQRLTAAGLPVRLELDLGSGVLSSAVEVSVFRIVQEALANVVKHAGATAAEVRVRTTTEAIEVTVEDDGHGRPTASVAGVGTRSMGERARELGGELDIRPGPHGLGTRVQARIPL